MTKPVSTIKGIRKREFPDLTGGKTTKDMLMR